MTLIKSALYISVNLLWIIIFFSYHPPYSISTCLFSVLLLVLSLLFMMIIFLFMPYIRKMNQYMKIITPVVFTILFYLIYKSSLFLNVSHYFPSGERKSLYDNMLTGGFFLFFSICCIYLLTVMLYNNLSLMDFITILIANFLVYNMLFIGMGIFSNGYKYISMGASSDHLSYGNSIYYYSTCLCLISALSSLIFFVFEIWFSYHSLKVSDQSVPFRR